MLTPRQTKFLGELMKCGKKTEAIKNTGISTSTAYKWMNEPEFKSELQKRKTAMLDEVCTAMQIGFSDAVDELMQIIKKKGVSDQVKVNAIDCLFRNARPIIEDVDILTRIQKLEEGVEGES